ncbi:hypothetical protein CU044_6150 [Streptomyces sp. L-9-10]|uniref:hypothetical protein n=1 Tax=Streptomyces sp. L-9-10 TaxID=1478131 RepID=UPI00101DFE6B|nr:hypothetical protein [Streptomyces sp. L-9-10]RYJ21766.1 hypothetical protein CU044_6150 [Streptomyces sp. L-9-10]
MALSHQQRDQIERRVRAAGRQPDPREARIARPRDLNQRITGKLARTHTELTQLKEHHQFLLSVLAAKDDEVRRLRHQLSTSAAVPDQRQGDEPLASSSCPAADVTPV